MAMILDEGTYKAAKKETMKDLRTLRQVISDVSKKSADSQGARKFEIDIAPKKRKK